MVTTKKIPRREILSQLKQWQGMALNKAEAAPCPDVLAYHRFIGMHEAYTAAIALLEIGDKYGQD